MYVPDGIINMPMFFNLHCDAFEVVYGRLPWSGHFTIDDSSHMCLYNDKGGLCGYARFEEAERGPIDISTNSV